MMPACRWLLAAPSSLAVASLEAGVPTIRRVGESLMVSVSRLDAQNEEKREGHGFFDDDERRFFVSTESEREREIAF